MTSSHYINLIVAFFDLQVCMFFSVTLYCTLPCLSSSLSGLLRNSCLLSPFGFSPLADSVCFCFLGGGGGGGGGPRA